MKNKTAKITNCLIVFLFFTLSFLLRGPSPVSTAMFYDPSYYSYYAPSPPVITETDPAIYPQQENLPISQIIRIVFSQNMDRETTRSALAVYQLSETGAIHQVEGACSVEGNVLTFTPASFLAVGSIYQISMSRNATDTYGNRLQGIQNSPPGEGDILWYFVTVADTASPEITECSPASEDTDILPQTDISFHIRDNKAGVNPDSLILEVNDKPVIPSLTLVSKTDLLVTYSPATPFNNGEKVPVSIQAADFVGNSVDHSYSFTTTISRRFDQFWSKQGESMTNSAAMAIDGEDHLWVAVQRGADGSEGGVKMFDGSRWRRYSSASGLGGDSATAIAVDSHDNVWVGLGPDAALEADSDAVPKLAQFDGDTWTLYSATALGVSVDEEINEIAVDSNDHIWIATTQSGVIEFYNGLSLHRGLEDNGQEDIQVRAMAVDKNGDIWAGTVPYGILRLQGEVWEQYVYSIHAKDPIDFTVNDLAVDDYGKIWAATNSGLLQLVPKADSGSHRWMHFIPSQFVNAVAVDRRTGYVWVGTKDGLIRFDGQSSWVNYSLEESYYPLSTESITHLAINPNTKHSEIWVSGSASLARRDENYPRIASTSPLAGAADVPKNASVTITFTEAMDQSSSEFFRLYDSRQVVAGRAIIDGDLLTFTPSSPFKENETYTFKAGQEMKDLSGNKLDASCDGLGGEGDDSFSASFKAENEKISPQVVSVFPLNGAKDVPPNVQIRVTFKEAMDQKSGGSFGLYDSQRVKVSGLVTIVGNVLTFTLPSSSVLKEGGTYTIEAGIEMQDLAGNRLDGNKNGQGGEVGDTFSASFTVLKKAALPLYNGGWLPQTVGGLTPNYGSGLIPQSGGWLTPTYTGGLAPSYNNSLPANSYTGFLGGLTSSVIQPGFTSQWSSWSPLSPWNSFNVFPQVNMNPQLGLPTWNSSLSVQPLWNTWNTVNIPFSPFGLFPF